MNAITNVEDLIRYQADLGTPYFVIYSDKIGDQNKMFDNYRTDDNTQENAQKQLREYISKFNTSGCNFMIWFVDKPNSNKGGFKVPFYMPANAQAINQQPQQIGAIQPHVNVHEEIAKAIETYKREQEIAELKKQLAEHKQLLKEQKPSGFDRIVDRMEPVFPHLINGLMSTLKMGTPTIGKVELPTQTQPQEQMEKTEEQISEIQQRAENAIVRLSKSYPDQTHEILEIIANWAENESDLPKILTALQTLQVEDPSKYNMAKSFL